MTGPASGRGVAAGWRHALLAGFAAGLAASGWIAPPPGWQPAAIAGAAGLLHLGRARRGRRRGAGAEVAWLALLGGFAALAGLGAGAERLQALAAGAAEGAPGTRVVAEGFVAGPVRSWGGEARAPLETSSGRLMVVVPDAGPEALPVTGSRIAAAGTLRAPEPWLQDDLRRLGIALELHAGEVRPLPGSRGGLTGYLDRVRDRAEAAVGAGMGEEEAALARGFVLGQDDAIAEQTRERFRRSGLAHLLAVSGQNVMLLAVLAGALFALAGVPLRLRLLLTLALIALYVPVAGGGPSIQRAGIMAAAALVATLASRPADRLYALLTAAAGTLALNPLAAGDVGWQLSFAAVTGIMLVAAPLRERLLAGAIGRLPERLGRPLAEGAALTVAATLATAPLLAHHFGTLSLASLPANLLALPLVAPIMWLGMLAALAGQLPVIPVEPLGAVAGVLIGWLDGVARLMSAPGWAQVGVSLGSPAAVVAAYGALGAGLLASLAAHRRRDGLAVPRAARVLGPLLPVLVLLLAGGGGERGDGIAERRAGALRIVQLDVGQGDAILLDPPRGRSLLVDTGPPGGGLAEALGRHGAERLAAVVITHHQLDHDGALSEIAGSVPFGRLIVGPSRPPQAAAVAAESGASVLPVAAGSELRSGRLEIDFLWPAADEGPAAADANAEALVLAVRFRGYSALLSADAEQELTHLDPGPLDVLKVAHHGSADAGLGALLDRSAPRVALIGVGENSYGHPTTETLETLAERGVCTLRTDLDGDVWAEIGPGGVSIGAQSGGLSERPACGPGG